MTKNLSAFRNMSAIVKAFLDSNKEIVDKYQRLNLEQQSFSINLAEMEIEAGKQTAVITGITADKVSSFTTAGEMMVSLSQKAIVWARDNNNQALEAVFSLTPTKFKTMSYSNKLDQLKLVFATLNGNAAALVAHNVKDTELATFATLIENCNTAIIAPSKATAGKKTAKSSMKTTQAKMDRNLANMDSMVLGEFAKTDPAFVAGYFNSRKMENTGVRHTGISATITAAATGKPIENATLIINGITKTATSNMAGLAEIIKMKAGSYHISISANGYTTQLQDVTVPKSKVIELAVALVIA